MTDNERDTQFMMFANLLWDDLVIRGRLGMKSEYWRDTHDPEFLQSLKRIIAQRAYDLVEYNLNHKDLQGCEVNELRASDFSDLTEFPPT